MHHPPSEVEGKQLPLYSPKSKASGSREIASVPKSTFFVKYEGEPLDRRLNATKKLHHSQEERTTAGKNDNYLDPEYFQVSTFSVPEALRRSSEVSDLQEGRC